MTTAQSSILIVDDDKFIRRILSRQLVKDGFHCTEACNAADALEQIQARPFDLVILDIMMPGKSGIDILPQIKAEFPDTAVIMATAVTDINVIIGCMREGAQDYLPKPYNLETISKSVEWVLHKRRMEQEMKRYQQLLKTSLTEQTRQVRKIFIGAIESLVAALESSDVYTAGHSRRVMQISMAIGKELGLTSFELENLSWGALLHDIGKIALDPAIRNKPAKLTKEEYAYVMEHVNTGPAIVQSIANEQVVEMIRYHHCHYDGNGFQQTLKGEEIPFSARILVVADSYDAMTSNRPYRTALTAESAVEELKRCSGTQFDPKIVQAFLSPRFSEESFIA